MSPTSPRPPLHSKYGANDTLQYPTPRSSVIDVPTLIAAWEPGCVGQEGTPANAELRQGRWGRSGLQDTAFRRRVCLMETQSKSEPKLRIHCGDVRQEKKIDEQRALSLGLLLWRSKPIPIHCVFRGDDERAGVHRSSRDATMRLYNCTTHLVYTMVKQERPLARRTTMLDQQQPP